MEDIKRKADEVDRVVVLSQDLQKLLNVSSYANRMQETSLHYSATKKITTEFFDILCAVVASDNTTCSGISF